MRRRLRPHYRRLRRHPLQHPPHLRRAAAARSIMRAEPAVVNGEPRSLTNATVTTGSRYRRLLRLGSVVAEPVVVLGGLLRSASNGSALWMSRASRLTSIQDNSST
jgi:hypothetical protein